MDGFATWKDSLVDLSQTKFEKINIYEVPYEDDFEYKCDYKIDIKYHNVDTDNKVMNKYLNNNVVVNSDTLIKQYSERPMNVLKKAGVAPEDIKEGTVDYALNDFVTSASVGELLTFIYELFQVNIPRKVFEKAYSDNAIEVNKGPKIVNAEFDFRKHETSTITLMYDDGTSRTVQLKNKVTSDDVDDVIPGGTLFSLYYDLEKMLKEDYEGTIAMLNEIFGFDVETLKGASVK